jgi:hypothetical protein
MRKGYTILEVLGMLGFLVLIFTLAFKPTRIMISDVPRQNRDFQTAASLNHMLNCLKTDIEAAKELTTNEPNTLIILEDEKTITYHFNDEQIHRMEGNDPNATSFWTLPHNRLEWEVKNQNALQITGWLERTLLGITEKKFHNSHLFFAKGFKPGESQ